MAVKIMNPYFIKNLPQIERYDTLLVKFKINC